ncbi:MAG: NAD(P)-binding domain-containing protein [Candidatus Eisenbacteria bacterium]
MAMERIGLVGVSTRRAGPGTLQAFTIPKEEQADRLPELRRALGAKEMIYLATCNRVEVAFHAEEDIPIAQFRPRIFELLQGRSPQPGESERALRIWAGEGAVEHMFLVASGLDSAQVGEREIRTQMRDAQKKARELGLSSSLLDFLMSEALKVSAEVHRSVNANRSPTSLADVATEKLLERHAKSPGPVALVGVSPMTRICARSLTRAGVPVIVVNRTKERADELVAEVGGESRSLAEFLEAPDGVEAVLLATGSPEPVLKRPTLERLAARVPSGVAPLLIDMAIPPDVDPEAAREVGLPRMTMDEITQTAEASRQSRLLDLAPAREIVDEGLATVRTQLADKIVGPVIAKITQRYRDTANEGVERLFRKELKNLGEEEREAVRRWAEVLAKRFAHVPVLGLRGLAEELGAGAVRTFLEATHEDLYVEPVFDGLESITEMEGVES